jgi:4-amino-4-deoxy-L-arabinose transferase-like glycosyltransferase
LSVTTHNHNTISFDHDSASGEQEPSHRLQLLLIVAILLIAAFLRIMDLSRSPAGFSPEETVTIQVTETARLGAIASFYKIGDLYGGHEGLFPVLQTIITGIVGNGLLGFRVLSLWCGLVSVALTFALGRRLFGSYVGLVAAAALAVTFWAVLLSRCTIREALVLPLLLALLLLIARALHLIRTFGHASPSTLSFTLVGIFISLLAYTHWTGLIGFGIFAAYLIYIVLSRQPISRRIISYAGYSILLAFILGIPYIAFTVRLPQISGLYTYWASRPTDIPSFFSSLIQTIAALFIVGDASWVHNVATTPLVGIPGSILLFIGLFAVLRRWRSANMGLVLLAFLFGLFPDIWSRQPASFTTLTVALPAIVLLIGLGSVTVAEWAKLRVTILNTRLMLITGLVTAISVFVIIFMLFAVWGKSSEVDIAYRGQLGRIAAYLDRNQDELTTTVCTFNLSDGAGKTLSDKKLLVFMMHRQDAPLRFSDCLSGFVLADGGSTQRIAFADPKIPSVIHPTFKTWIDESQMINDGYLRPDSIYTINVETKLADALGKLVSGFVEWSPETVGPSEKAALPVRMGGYLTFEGYELDTKKWYKPGDMVTIVTYWRADGNQIPDLRVFTHILANLNAEPVAQNDTLSVEPDLLRNRDIFIQVVTIPLPNPFPDGEYTVSVGAYSNDTGDRLPVYDNDQPRGNRLFLAKIMVKN